MNTKTIKQSTTFNATPERVYDLLMEEQLHAAFTGSEVSMSTEINGVFSVYDGYCKGYNIELKRGKKIVQAWHFEEDGWPEDHYSICTFLFSPSGNKTILEFTQTDVPEHKVEALKTGWKDYYWELMEAYLLVNENV